MEETPRWEYRCWTNRTHAQSLFAGNWQASPVEHRQDLYLIGPDTTFMPKLRDGAQFEIKRLLQTRSGMELWAPYLSASLPHMPDSSDQLAAAAMQIFQNARQPADFFRIAAGAEHWIAVPVDKSRRLFSLDDLRCEVTRVTVAEKQYWTFAAETAEFSALVQLVEKLQLQHLPNVNYRNFLIDKYRFDS